MSNGYLSLYWSDSRLSAARFTFPHSFIFFHLLPKFPIFRTFDSTVLLISEEVLVTKELAVWLTIGISVSYVGLPFSVPTALVNPLFLTGAFATLGCSYRICKIVVCSGHVSVQICLSCSLVDLGGSPQSTLSLNV